MARQKVVDQRRDKTLAKRGSAGQPQHTGGLLLEVTDRIQCFLKPIEQLATVIKVNRAGIRQGKPPSGAVQQLRPQLGFQPRHQPAHVRAGDPQVPGGARKGSQPHHLHEGLNSVPMLHCCS